MSSFCCWENGLYPSTLGSVDKMGRYMLLIDLRAMRDLVPKFPSLRDLYIPVVQGQQRGELVKPTG